MTSGTPSNMAASVHQRLLNKARATGRPFGELLQYFTMERFLYRLGQSEYADRFVLKGALMLQVWNAPASRPTMDIDLEGYSENSLDNIALAVKNICLGPVEDDGLSFGSDSVSAERIIENAQYGGVRVRFEAFLGRARISMQVDIGFGDVITPEAGMITVPTILDFPAPRLKGYTMVTAVAEKFAAMTVLGELNSRMKDFYDIWWLCRMFEFDGRVLAEAISRTFSNRGIAYYEEPVALSDAFTMNQDILTRWLGFINRSRLSDAPESFGDVISVIRAFLGPLNKALFHNQEYGKIWKPSGPWIDI